MTSTTISPQVRIVALVGVLLIAFGGSAFFLLRGHSTPARVTTTPPAEQHQTDPSKHVHVHVVLPAVNPQLPAPLHSALEHSSVVVAGFYNPNASADSLTISEARAGAAAAHVGFVAVNLLDDSVAGPLTALLPANEILPNPGIAIYGRSGVILYRSDGYLPEAAVAQAVKDWR